MLIDCISGCLDHCELKKHSICSCVSFLIYLQIWSRMVSLRTRFFTPSSPRCPNNTKPKRVRVWNKTKAAFNVAIDGRQVQLLGAMDAFVSIRITVTHQWAKIFWKMLLIYYDCELCQVKSRLRNLPSEGVFEVDEEPLRQQNIKPFRCKHQP